MGSNLNVTITFEVDQILQPIYTGGDAALDSSSRILATCLGEEALLTDLQSGDSLARIEGDGGILTSLLITPSASHLIACSRSLSMRIYALEPSEVSNRLNVILTRTLKPHNTPVVTATIDRTGTLLATGSADGVIKIWDIRGGFNTHTFRGHSGVISALRFFEASGRQMVNGLPLKTKHKSSKKNSDQDVDMANTTEELHDATSTAFRLASGGEDGKIRIWDLVKRKAIQTLDSHGSVIRGIDFSTDEYALVSASRDRTMIVWDARTWKVRKVVPVLEVLESVGFVNEGRLIYTGGEKGKIRMWNTNSGREITREQEPGGEADGIIHVFYSSPLNLLLSVHADQSLLIHSLVSLGDLGADGMVDALPLLRRISGTHDEVIDLAYVSPGQELMALATNSESLRLVSLRAQSEGEDATLESQYFGADVALLQGHEDIIISLDVDWSGCWIATGAKDNTARLWRVDHKSNSYACFSTLTGHTESLGAIALPGDHPPAGSAAEKDPLSHPPAFILTGSQDKTIKRWDISSGTQKHDRKAPRAVYTRKAHDKDINALATNHSSTLFASASQDRTVKIWSVEDGEVQGVLRGHKRGVWSVAFATKETSYKPSSGGASSSRGFAVTGSGDKTVKVWSLSSYDCLLTLEGHANSVLKVLWLPPRPHLTDSATTNSHPSTKCSSLIASAGGDGLVKIWDAQSGDCVSTLDNHTDRIWALAAHPSSGSLVSGGGDSVVTFWKDTSAATAAATAAASTARVEQEQELQNYAHRGNYRDAIVLALQLNHPARLLALFTSVVNTDPQEEGSLSGLKAVDEVLAGLADEQIFTLLLRLRDWNTNARTAPVAQRILWVVVKSYPASRLTSLRRRGKGSALGEVLDGLRVYTERHYKRMEELLEESYMVDFVVREMGEGGYVGGEEEGVDAPLGEHGQDVVMA